MLRFEERAQKLVRFGAVRRDLQHVFHLRLRLAEAMYARERQCVVIMGAGVVFLKSEGLFEVKFRFFKTIRQRKQVTQVIMGRSEVGLNTKRRPQGWFGLRRVSGFEADGPQTVPSFDHVRIESGGIGERLNGIGRLAFAELRQPQLQPQLRRTWLLPDQLFEQAPGAGVRLHQRQSFQRDGGTRFMPHRFFIGGHSFRRLARGAQGVAVLQIVFGWRRPVFVESGLESRQAFRQVGVLRYLRNSR